MGAGAHADVALADVWQTLRERWRVVGLVVLLTVAVATYFGVIWPKSYSATAVVTVNPITTAPFGATPINQQINIVTERAIVQSSEVANLARKGAGGGLTAGEITDAIQVSSPLDSQILEITATLDDRAGASRTANAVAQAYLKFRADGAAAVATRVSNNLDSRIAQLSSTLSDDPAKATLPSQVAIQEQISALRQQQSDLSVVAVNPGRIVTTARPAPKASGPGLLLFIGPGLVLGLMCGLALALGREHLDTKIRNHRRLTALTGRPVLAGSRGADDRELVRRASLRLALMDSHTGSPLLLGVLGVDDGDTRPFCEQLGDYLRDRGVEAPTVDVTSSVAPAALDQGWPGPTELLSWNSAEVVLVSLSSTAGLFSCAQVAMAAQRLDKVLVVVGTRTRRRQVLDLLVELDGAAVGVDLLVLVRSRRRRTPRSAPVRSARVPAGAGGSGDDVTRSTRRGSPGSQAPELGRSRQLS